MNDYVSHHGVAPGVPAGTQSITEELISLFRIFNERNRAAGTEVEHNILFEGVGPDGAKLYLPDQGTVFVNPERLAQLLRAGASADQVLAAMPTHDNVVRQGEKLLRASVKKSLSASI